MDSPIAKEKAMTAIKYRTAAVDGSNIFYREAGQPEAPTLLLLHGFPSSSRMYEPLLTRLSERFHLVAPDYPGFGHSDAPDPQHFCPTFETLVIQNAVAHLQGAIPCFAC